MKNRYVRLIAIIAPVLIAIICIAVVVKNNNQAFMTVPLEIGFSGEYSYDGQNWYPYDEKEDISSYKGDVTIKGHFDSDIFEGGILNLYCNHIGVSIYVNGEMLYIDAPAEMKEHGIALMPSMCGKRWEQVLCPTITTEDEIEFRFNNSHKYGNKNAYKEVIASLMVTPMDESVLEVYLKPYIRPFEMAGYAVLIIAVLLLGSSLASAILKGNITGRMFKMGIATLLAGGYMVLDIMMVYFRDELLAVKTYGSRLCLMLTIYFIGIMICDTLSGKCRKIAAILMGSSGIINVAIIVASTTQKVLLYDTQFVWAIAQYVISTAMIVLCIAELRKKNARRLECVTYIGINIAIIFDMLGVGYYMYYSGVCFKAVYILMLVVFLVYGVKNVIRDHQASLKNKKLKEELEQSRITVMLSQIQPHFLYNSLTSVMDLCDVNPKLAKNAIADFADYLRGNLSSLKTEKLIPFRTELEHIKKYLSLEKLRFQEELEVVYDINTEDFVLPVLSVQPLVENAVKHGVGKKIGGGTVTIHTSESESHYIIRISDDGVGFVVGGDADHNNTHVGIDNTKRRLDLMIGGDLEIESEKGKGTIASILIPKRRE